MPSRTAPPGVRVVIDLRPLQEPDRSPATAAYLGHLLAAFAAEPSEGEAFVALLQTGRPDPTASLGGLPVRARRWLPPTRALRSSALALDPFLLRGAAVGVGRGGEPAVYHIAGAGLPLAAGLPVVATLLDLAPWELPAVYQASAAARFGERLRARMLRDAAFVLVGTQTTSRTAARLLHLRADRLRVVPPAPDPAFRAVREDPEALAAALAAERRRIGLSERYLAFFGRHDARSDLATLFDALAVLAARPRPEALRDGVPWPPSLLLVGANPDDRAALARTAARRGVSGWLSYAPYLPAARLATLVAGARAVILPSLSDAAGLPAIDALAAGTPVIASAVGALPEIVGRAGILVEPNDPARLARAVEAAWADDTIHGALEAAAETADGGRTWPEVAAETRAIYAIAAARGRATDRRG